MKYYKRLILLLWIALSATLNLIAQNRQTNTEVTVAKNSKRDSAINVQIELSANNFTIPEGGVVIGDSLPEYFWDIQLRVVNHPHGNSRIFLRDFKEKSLLVLDFWARYCKPCVESIDKWDEWQQRFSAGIAVVPIHLYFPSEEALPFAEKKGWKLPISVGNKADTLLNNLFYAYRSFGQVWIKDGKLFAIPKHSAVDLDLIIRILTNQPYEIEMNDYLTYFDKSYRIEDEDDTKDSKQ